MNNFENWPLPTIKAIQKAFRKASVNLDFCDNFRVAHTDSAEEMAVYHVAIKKGCCGFFDSILRFGGREIAYGFNYGH